MERLITSLMRMPAIVVGAMSPDCAPTCPRCRRFRAAVGAALVLGVIGAGLLGVRWRQACAQQKAVVALLQIERCEVAYDGGDVFRHETMFGSIFGGDEYWRLAPVGWGEALFGKHLAQRCDTVGVDRSHVDEVVPHLPKLPFLRRVVIHEFIDDDQELSDPTAAAKVRACVPGVELQEISFDLRIVDNEGPAELTWSEREQSP